VPEPAYILKGLGHVVAPGAADHLLFLVVLAVIYRRHEWRSALRVVIAFTAAHTVSVALLAANVLAVPAGIVEFLIPITIVLACAESLVARRRAAGVAAPRRVLFAGVFGLVHGAGLAHLDLAPGGSVVAPITGFTLGLTAGQLAVLFTALGTFWAFDEAVRLTHPARQQRYFEARVVTVSVTVALVAAGWAWTRWPW
jgi:hypothetical protein